ncbi:unnamed protein product [Alopecurus aequalis]
MANYPCNPIPHLPPGVGLVPNNGLRPQRGYAVMGGNLPIAADDWAIISNAPEPNWEAFQGTTLLITDQLHERGYHLRQISRCGMGTPLVRFNYVSDRDMAVGNSPYFIRDLVMRITGQNRGINHRTITFTHNVWLMLVSYPQECWNLDTIVTTMAEYGRLLVWNRDNEFRARIIVKIRAYDIHKIPLSIVIINNTTDIGHGDGWACPTYILSASMLGVQASNEDPLPPDGQNPHPIPIVVDDFAMWHADNEGPPPQPPVAPAPQNNDDPMIQAPAPKP